MRGLAAIDAAEGRDTLLMQAPHLAVALVKEEVVRDARLNPVIPTKLAWTNRFAFHIPACSTQNVGTSPVLSVSSGTSASSSLSSVSSSSSTDSVLPKVLKEVAEMPLSMPWRLAELLALHTAVRDTKAHH